MEPARLVVVVDAGAPLDRIDRALADWRAWLGGLGWEPRLAIEILAVGTRASWVPDRATLAGSAVVRGVGAGGPALVDALTRVPDETTALAVVLARAPTPGWEASAQARAGGVDPTTTTTTTNAPTTSTSTSTTTTPTTSTAPAPARGRPPFAPIRCVVTTSAVPPAAAGQGLLGTPFAGEHLPLALRWLTCEVLDRCWACACGALQLYRGPEPGRCARCGEPLVLPPRLRIGGRVVLLQPGARLFPHHLGRPLSFEAPVAVVEPAPTGSASTGSASTGSAPSWPQGPPRSSSGFVPTSAGEPRRLWLGGRPLAEGPLEIGGVPGTVRLDPGPAARSSRRFRARTVRARVDRCHACEGPLGSPVFHVAPDPRRFCAACVSAPDRCDFCWLPLGGPGGGSTWPDGRAACRDCWTTAVTELADLEDLAVRARRFLERRLGMTMPPCPLRFEHAAAIARLHGRTFRPTRGSDSREAGHFRAAPEPEILIEHASPRNFAYGVLVHELTHLWQFGHWQVPAPLPVVEGLAMWAEYHALLDAGAIHEARRVELLGDPVYGLGFRIALAVEKEVGFDQVKSALPQVGSLPPLGP